MTGCVVHGWWALPAHAADPGHLVLWAEDATGPAPVPRRRSQRARVQSHPFALEADELRGALGLDRTVPAGEAVLDLPGFTHTPLASPQLSDLGVGLGAAAAEGEQPRRRDDVRWSVPTLQVPPAEALLFLARAAEMHPDEAPDGLEGVHFGSMSALWGAELRSLALLAGFAGDLARRGRVLPVALPPPPGETGGLPSARWRPVVSGPDADWLRSAVAALPPSYGAGLQPGEHLASAAAAVDALTDELVRLRLEDERPRNVTLSGLAGWRAALRRPDARFRASPDQLAALVRALDRWQSDALGNAIVRAVFRLVEPRDDDEESVLRRADEAEWRSAEESQFWRVDLGLQLADEPSRFIPARAVWDGVDLPAALTAEGAPWPQEVFLAELGRAVRLYPGLSAALSGPRPVELLLDTVEAHEFLAEAAPLLLGAGFGVQLPGWWGSARARVGARLRAGTSTQPGRVDGTPRFGQEHLVDFDWQLSLGDHVLTGAEIDDLLEANRPLVRLRGQWMQVDPEKLRAARDFLRRQAKARMTVGDVLRVIGAGDEAPGGLTVTGVDAEGWLAHLLSPDGGRSIEPVAAPDAFTGTLRPYQERGLAWLSFLESVGLGGVLADDMGLGKTVQLLALFASDLGAGEGGGPTLLVCPMSLLGTWEREAARFAPQLRVHVHHGAGRLSGDDFEKACAEADLVVTTYSLLARDAALLRGREWRRVVLDEAQAVKNAATQASVAARTLTARSRFAVTGTPVENRLADLWSLMEFANPRLLGDAAAFKKRFALPIERVGDAEAAARLKALTQPFVLRRLKTDSSIIDDLPPKLEMEIPCPLTGEQAALYQGVVDEMLERIDRKDGIERRGLVLAAMTKLKQVCNHPALLLHDGSRVPGRSGKIARLEAIVEEILEAGEKALLFTQFASFGATLQTHLAARFGREVAFLHGGVDRRGRDELVQRFQQKGSGPPLFVLSLKAGGTGLTLTEANHVIHVDRWWNPAVEDQATDRAFRIGQSRTVQVRTFVCAGTLEEKIAAMIRDKRALAETVVGTGEQWLTELSTDQLRDLVTLDRAVVG